MRPFLLLALAAALPAGAQTMYRCGAAFSDKPCGPGQQVIAAPAPAAQTARPQAQAAPDTQVTPEVRRAAEAACTARLTKDVSFLDPDSVRVTSVSRRGVLQIGGQPLRVYGMRVNAKNGYGGYAGEKDFLCLADPADERLIVLVKRANYER